MVTKGFCRHCMKKNLRKLRKFVKKDRKDIAGFRFTEISNFLNFPSNENARKQHMKIQECAFLSKYETFVYDSCT